MSGYKFLLRFSQTNMMQNVSNIPTTSWFWRLGRRYSSLTQNSKMKNFQGPHHARIHHLSRVVQSPVFRSKICDLCGKASSVLKIRGYTYQKKCGNEDEDLGLLGDVEMEFDENGNLSKNVLDLFRVNLYPDSNNEVIRQLMQAASVQDVFNIVEKCGQNLTAEQSSQAVVTLRDVQKVYGSYGISFPRLKNIDLGNFLNTIISHKTFDHLLSHIETVSEDLDSNAISCLLLCLYRLGIKESSPVMQKLVMLAVERLDNFSFSALSRLCVYLRYQGLGGYYLQAKIVSLLSGKLSMLSTPEDLKLVTICLNGTVRIISKSMFKEYEDLMLRCLREGKLDCSDSRTMLKYLKFLNRQDWVRKPNVLQRELMLSMSEKIHTLSAWEIITLNSYFQNLLEPKEIQYKIQERARSLLEQSKTSSMKVELMFCMLPFNASRNRPHLEEIIVECLYEESFFDLITVIFKCLRSIKTSNFELCDAFWSKAFTTVEKEIHQIEEPYFGMEEFMRGRVYQRYMYFNNNLGGTYRNYKIEKNLSELFLKDLRGNVGIFPGKVARMTSFLIGYSKRHGIPEDILTKVLVCAPQFSLSDIVLLSRGIQISLGFNHHNTRGTYTQQITSICHVLNSCTEIYLKKVKSLDEVCRLTRGFLIRGGSPRTFLYDALVRKLIQFIGELGSRIMIDISINFYRTKYLSSEVLEYIAQYVIDNQEYMVADTVERFLNCMFILGYRPKCSEEFFSACLNIFKKDSRSLSGLSYLEMNIALCFYGYLKANAIEAVFNISFLDQLDEEIAACYSKVSYPYRVRHSLMELNRAVCIDHPEAKVPWFHEKYCEELVETVAVPNTEFHSEVHQALWQLIGGPEVVRPNVKTPYFYLVDFEFLLTGDDQPVPVSEYAPASKKTGMAKDTRIENYPGYRRIAVLLRNDNNYCVNTRQLLGRHEMECRHLEVLGYQVVEIPHFMWYSMAHATPGDRVQYLKRLIYS